MARILVVDDEENIRLLYKEEMTEEGYEVETASDGEDALAKIRARRPDLVVLDIRMPGMDGLECLSKIREIDMMLPVVIATAYGSFRQDFASWPSDSYVTKSSDLAHLKSEVRRLLAG